MGTFAVDSPAGVMEAVNYAISNLAGQGLQADIATGVISAPGDPDPVGYLYQYLHVRYADNNTGTVNFSTAPTNRLFYGLRNTNSTVSSSNPTDYIWYQVTGGFSTNKFLFYNSLGGRQVLLEVSTTSPGLQFLQTQNGVPIDLDIITTTGGQQVVVVGVYQRANVTPATPTGGTYDFGNLVLTPPVGWNASIPAGTNPIYSSQNTFQAPAGGNGTVGPATTWTTPEIISQNGPTGATGPQGASGPVGASGPSGTRGFIPLAYVLTPSTPVTANTAVLTSWFSALRTNSVPPIGVSPDAGNIYTPVPGDTAQFFWSSGNIGVFRTYDGTSWSSVTGQVIDGNVLVNGTVTANSLNTNNLYTLKIQSTGATFGDNSSQGFWLDAGNGTARFGNAVNIGTNLTVGNNAVIGNALTVGNNASIGGNLNVTGLITASGLIANTVNTVTILPGAISSTDAVEINGTPTIQANATYGTYYFYSGTGGNVAVDVDVGDKVLVWFDSAVTASFTGGQTSPTNVTLSMYIGRGEGNTLPTSATTIYSFDWIFNPASGGNPYDLDWVRLPSVLVDTIPGGFNPANPARYYIGAKLQLNSGTARTFDLLICDSRATGQFGTGINWTAPNSLVAQVLKR